MITNVLSAETAPPHLLAKARPRLEGPDHPDSLIKACVTRAREFSKLATYKSPGRLYRVRVGLTVEANGRFDPNFSEDVIFLDCYLLPRRVNKRDRGTGSEREGGAANDDDDEPPGPASVGERITLRVIKDRKKDTATVKEFTVEVTDVYWGSFVRTSTDDGEVEERNSLTLGLIEVHVQERFERSLIMDSEYDLKAHKYSMAA